MFACFQDKLVNPQMQCLEVFKLARFVLTKQAIGRTLHIFAECLRPNLTCIYQKLIRLSDSNLGLVLQISQMQLRLNLWF